MEGATHRDRTESTTSVQEISCATAPPASGNTLARGHRRFKPPAKKKWKFAFGCGPPLVRIIPADRFSQGFVAPPSDNGDDISFARKGQRDANSLSVGAGTGPVSLAVDEFGERLRMRIGSRPVSTVLLQTPTTLLLPAAPRFPAIGAPFCRGSLRTDRGELSCLAGVARHDGDANDDDGRSTADGEFRRRAAAQRKHLRLLAESNR